MKKQVFAAIGLAVAAVGAQAQVLLSEGFEDTDKLASNGWLRTNNSSPVGPLQPWTQGASNIFTAQSGGEASFIASIYGVGTDSGTINAWLITPTFATDKAVDVTFYARADNAPGYFDQIAYGWSNGSATPGSFSMSAATTVGTAGWTQYTLHIAAQGAGTTGRFAINYTGLGANAAYVGVDSLNVSVAAAVPEPSTMLLMGAGMLGLAGWARRRAAR